MANTQNQGSPSAKNNQKLPPQGKNKNDSASKSSIKKSTVTSLIKYFETKA